MGFPWNSSVSGSLVKLVSGDLGGLTIGHHDEMTFSESDTKKPDGAAQVVGRLATTLETTGDSPDNNNNREYGRPEGHWGRFPAFRLLQLYT